MNYNFHIMKKVSPYIPFILFFLIFYSFMQTVELNASSDDMAHMEALEKLGVFGWVMLRAENWLPRLFSDFFYAILINQIGVWKVVNAIIAALLVLGVWRTVFGQSFLRDSLNRRTILLLASTIICLLFFFIYPNAVTSSSIWYTGSFNYLWPVTAMIYALTPFIYFLRGDAAYPSKTWIPISIFASICASFTEQTAAVSIGVTLVLVLYQIIKKRMLPIALLIQFAVIVVCSAFYLYFVLTSARIGDVEELALFNEFAEFGKRDKLWLGIHAFDAHLLRSSNLLFLALALLAGFLAWKRLECKNIFFRIISFLPAFYILLNVFPFRLFMSGTWNYPKEVFEHTELLSAFEYDSTYWFDFLDKVPPLSWLYSPRFRLIAIFAFVTVLFMLYPLFCAFKRKLDGLLASLLYLAAFGSGIIMGFSPTIFASGSRPFFLANIILLMLCAMLIREGMSDENPRIADRFQGKTAISKVLIGLIALISMYSILLFKFIFSYPFYWWY